MTIAWRAAKDMPGVPLKHFWSQCVGAGRANEGLRSTWRRHLRRVATDCGFKHVRFHGLFHDDMFVYRERNGKAIFNFQYVDDLFDTLLEAGVRPFVEFGFGPSDLASQKATVFWWKGNGAPPADYGKWEELIERTVSHWLTRYGAAEIRQWYFEVWNEPNLHPFFKGTRSQYFELYKTTARAVKKIDDALRVGGPATSNFVPDARFAGEVEDLAGHSAVTAARDLDALTWRPVWVEQFLAYCQRERLPVDFISCHPYPTDWALDERGKGRNYTRGVDSTRTDLALVRRLVRESPYPNAEIHLTEWSSSPSPRDFSHDYLQAATFIVKTNLKSIGLVDSLSYWTFTDVFEESGAGDTPFHGGFGMINYQDIVKPAFHAYRLLHTLGDQLLLRTPGGVLTRDTAAGKLAALAYHYPPEVRQAIPASFASRAVAEAALSQGVPEAFTLELSGMRPGAKVLVETLTRGAGDAMAAWRDMGAPDELTPEQARTLAASAEATRREYVSADTNGRLYLTRPLDPWAVLSVREQDAASS